MMRFHLPSRIPRSRYPHRTLAEQPQPLELEFKIFNVLRQLIHPKRRTLADSRELRGLEVGIGKARQRLILFGECRKIAQYLRRLAQQKL